MNDLQSKLDRASRELRQSVQKVRQAGQPAPHEPHPPALHPRRSDTAADQTIAALQAVVWIASFVQSVFNEMVGRSDDL